MDEPSQQKQPKPDHVETERERRIGNIILLGFFVVLVVIGIWLVNAMVEYRAIDDCIAQGRRDCAPVDAPRR